MSKTAIKTPTPISPEIESRYFSVMVNAEFVIDATTPEAAAQFVENAISAAFIEYMATPLIGVLDSEDVELGRATFIDVAQIEAEAIDH